MENSFLQQVAKSIIQSGRPLQNCCIVFPTRRAAVYFRREMAKTLDKPSWSPELLTMDDWLRKATNLVQLDTLTQVIYLYDSYRACTGLDEGFASFYHWGNMLLNDFNDIDAQLIHVEALLSDLSIQSELDYSFAEFLEPEQWALIQQFWKNSNPENSKSAQKFLVFWQKMLPIFQHFNARLDKEHTGYLGKIQRLAWNAIKAQEVHNYDYTWFVGFNNMNACAFNSMRKTIERGNAECFWDIDEWYLNGTSFSEAGTFLRRYSKDEVLGSSITEQLLHRIKVNKQPSEVGLEVDVVYTSEQNTQATVAQQEMSNWLKLYPDKEEEMVVILPASGMLQPVLHSLPQEMGKLNLTLYYPLRESAMFKLVEIVATLQKNAIIVNNTFKASKLDVLKLLSHPYSGFRNARELNELRGTVLTYQASDSVSAYFAPDALLKKNENESSVLNNFLTSILTRIGEGKNAIVYLYDILAQLYEVLKAENEKAYSFESELIYASMSALIALKQKLVDNAISLDSFQLLDIAVQVIQDISLPFTGEPLEGAQIMGFLETQCLDFENVIILNCTEGSLPPAANATGSFIPYNLRKAYKMTLPEDNEARYAYLFYRLFHRAKKVTLLHAEVTEDIGVTEPSRYISQLKYLFDWNLPIQLINRPLGINEVPAFSLPNTGLHFQEFIKKYKTDGTAFSPSSLNTWLDCKLKFYLNSILKIREIEGFSADMDMAQLGTIFHETLEEIYQSALLNKIEVTPAYINEYLPQIEDLVHAHLIKYVPIGQDEQQETTIGFNAVNEALIVEYVRKVLEYDRLRATKHPFRVVGLELKIGTTIPLTLHDGSTFDMPISGTIDRVDFINGQLDIIDYKTGSDKSSDIEIQKVLDNEYRSKNHIKASVQLLLYSYILSRQTTLPTSDFTVLNEMPIRGGLVKLKDLINEGKYYQHYLKFKKLEKSDATLLEIAQVMLPTLQEELAKMFNPATEILPTPNAAICTYCTYKALCQR